MRRPVVLVFGVLEEDPLTVEERDVLAPGPGEEWRTLGEAVERLRRDGYRCRDHWAPNIKKCTKNSDTVLVWLLYEPGGDPIKDPEAIP